MPGCYPSHQKSSVFFCFWELTCCPYSCPLTLSYFCPSSSFYPWISYLNLFLFEKLSCWFFTIFQAFLFCFQLLSFQHCLCLRFRALLVPLQKLLLFIFSRSYFKHHCSHVFMIYFPQSPSLKVIFKTQV